MKKETSEDQIKQWKEKHGDVFIITADDGKKAILKKADRNAIKFAMSRLAEKDLLGYVESIVTNCWLDGDEEMKTEPEYHIGMMKIIDQVVGSKNVELKKS